MEYGQRDAFVALSAGGLALDLALQQDGPVLCALVRALVPAPFRDWPVLALASIGPVRKLSRLKGDSA